MTYRQLIALAFLLNSILAIGTKAVSEFGMAESIPMVLLIMYGTGAIMSLAYTISGRKRIEGKAVSIALLGGIGTAVGMSSNMTAAAILPGYVVFPLVNGGTLVLVAVIGRLVFKERIGAFGVAGILAGIASIILLST